jgi:signal transduction histidine kinase
VRNLLDNAVKYSPNDSVIEVAVDAGESDAILCVRDGGIGIDAEMLPRLFDQFAQADSTTGRRAGGLGLGLPLVRAIVEEHGGSIAARSEGVGRGSEFTVRLPRG